MWIIFLLGFSLIGVIALITVWLGNKVINLMKKDNLKTELEMSKIKQDNTENNNENQKE